MQLRAHLIPPLSPCQELAWRSPATGQRRAVAAHILLCVDAGSTQARPRRPRKPPRDHAVLPPILRRPRAPGEPPCPRLCRFRRAPSPPWSPSTTLWSWPVEIDVGRGSSIHRPHATGCMHGQQASGPRPGRFERRPSPARAQRTWARSGHHRVSA
jgi:hypothetical protein